MERQYYVEKERETSETTNRLEAARIAADWKKRGYDVKTVVVDVTDQSVEMAEITEAIPPALESESAQGSTRRG
jgi:hypothetical protein